MTFKTKQKTGDDIRLYHTDHLGSTALVTDLDGEVTQHVAYIPYGEIFVEQRNGSWSSPYLFNAKELDEETGLYYYGARYLDPTGVRWLSVDRKFEKYAGISPYSYCIGNPIRLIDPNGNDISIVVDGETYTYNPKMKINEYSGENGIIKRYVSELNKMNRTRSGNKLLTTLHESKKNYKLTNGKSLEGSAHTSPQYNKAGEYEGATLNANNNIDLETISHELFHSYQYEKGQGGASIFNEIEAYTFQYKMTEEYNLSYDYDLSYYISPSSGFATMREDDENPIIGRLFESNFNKLLNGPFDSDIFESVMSMFREHSQANSECIYDRSYYEYKSENNKIYLIQEFFR